MTEFDLKILEADSCFYDGKCVSVVVSTTEGLYGVMAHHENMISALVIGEIKYTTPDMVEHYASISGGLMKVEDNEVLILVESIENPEDIDEERVSKEEREMSEYLLEKRSIEEYEIAQARMARAINRLKIKKKYGNRF